MRSIFLTLVFIAVFSSLGTAQETTRELLVANFKEIDKNGNGFVTFPDEFYPFAMTLDYYKNLPVGAAFNALVSASISIVLDFN